MEKELATIIIEKNGEEYTKIRNPHEYFTGHMTIEAGKIEKAVMDSMRISEQNKVKITFYG